MEQKHKNLIDTLSVSGVFNYTVNEDVAKKQIDRSRKVKSLHIINTGTSTCKIMNCIVLPPNGQFIFKADDYSVLEMDIDILFENSNNNNVSSLTTAKKLIHKLDFIETRIIQ